MQAAVDEALALFKTHDKIVIVSHFTSFMRVTKATVERVAPHLTGELFDGSLPSIKREAMVKRFLNNPDPKVLYLSLKAGGVGLNLVPGPSAMIFLSAWFSPAAHDQAIARLHRNGQMRQVQVTYLSAPGTITDATLKAHEDKRRCASAIMDMEGITEGGGAEVHWKKLSRIVNACQQLPGEKGGAI